MLATFFNVLSVFFGCATLVCVGLAYTIHRKAALKKALEESTSLAPKSNEVDFRAFENKLTLDLAKFSTERYVLNRLGKKEIAEILQIVIANKSNFGVFEKQRMKLLEERAAFKHSSEEPNSVTDYQKKTEYMARLHKTDGILM